MGKFTGRKIVIMFLIAACAAVVVGTLNYWRHALRPLDPTLLSDCTVKQLIDALERESPHELGTSSAAWLEPFAEASEDPKFIEGPLGPPAKLPAGLPEGLKEALGPMKPVISPVILELVRRGVKALPELIDHLADARPTRFIVKPPSNWWMRQSNEYDPRFADQSRWPPGISKLEDSSIVERYYRVRVGDLCYLAIGQIVNRDLEPVRYQPLNGQIINSPIETPILAAAVIADWGGLTTEGHKQALMQDALGLKKGCEKSALLRLRFYYPECYKAYLADMRVLTVSMTVDEHPYILAMRYDFGIIAFFSG